MSPAWRLTWWLALANEIWKDVMCTTFKRVSVVWFALLHSCNPPGSDTVWGSHGFFILSCRVRSHMEQTWFLPTSWCQAQLSPAERSWAMPYSQTCEQGTNVCCYKSTEIWGFVMLLLLCSIITEKQLTNTVVMLSIIPVCSIFSVVLSRFSNWLLSLIKSPYKLAKKSIFFYYIVLQPHLSDFSGNISDSPHWIRNISTGFY